MTQIEKPRKTNQKVKSSSETRAISSQFVRRNTFALFFFLSLIQLTQRELLYQISISKFKSMRKEVLIFVLVIAVRAEDSAPEITNVQAWIYGMLASIGLILLGAVNTSFIVCIQQCVSVKAFKIVINLLYALGCGAMLGDVMVHTLPKSLENKDVQSNYVALLFILAILSFILLERAFMECGAEKTHWQFHKDQMIKKEEREVPVPLSLEEQKKKQHQQENPMDDENMTLSEHFQSFHLSYRNMREMLKAKRNLSAEGQQNKRVLQLLAKKKKEEEKAAKLQRQEIEGPSEVKMITNQPLKKVREEVREEENVTKTEESEESKSQDIVANNNSEKEEEKGCIERLRGKAPAGYLNVLNSFVHTIFDGFAIGAGFGSGRIDQYLPVIIAVYAHEVPRQMGDVGVLMKSRFTGCQSIFFNSSPNIGTIVGAVVALAIGQINEEFKIYVLSFAAGNLTYIAADIWRHLFKNKHWWGNTLELIFFGLGVGIEYLLLLTESH